ncbi:hypothetical protein JTE90_008617 [Oedothorax gibbosus]|uniref:Chitin-binding type-2 domain-containing protein n=1 Tax=Oedothorax gibbosus TaxID=931172 RepID=A0AAV6UC14_9ARAC|nr:hypothetical protein JTE90_008617 [Oedothorax gibbosus]
MDLDRMRRVFFILGMCVTLTTTKGNGIWTPRHRWNFHQSEPSSIWASSEDNQARDWNSEPISPPISGSSGKRGWSPGDSQAKNNVWGPGDSQSKNSVWGPGDSQSKDNVWGPGDTQSKDNVWGPDDSQRKNSVWGPGDSQSKVNDFSPNDAQIKDRQEKWNEEGNFQGSFRPEDSQKKNQWGPGQEKIWNTDRTWQPGDSQAKDNWGQTKIDQGPNWGNQPGPGPDGDRNRDAGPQNDYKPNQDRDWSSEPSPRQEGVSDRRPEQGGNWSPDQGPSVGQDGVSDRRPVQGGNWSPDQGPGVGQDGVSDRRPVQGGNWSPDQGPSVGQDGGDWPVDQPPRQGGESDPNQGDWSPPVGQDRPNPPAGGSDWSPPAQDGQGGDWNQGPDVQGPSGGQNWPDNQGPDTPRDQGPVQGGPSVGEGPISGQGGDKGDTGSEVFPPRVPQGNYKGGDTPHPGGEDSGPWRIEDSIPGTPGVDYPNYSTVPKTGFDCKQYENPGYYGDVEAKCQVFHICQSDGRHDSFLCPLGTIFNQQYFVCVWWFNYNCDDTQMHYSLNADLYKSGPGQGHYKGDTYGGSNQGDTGPAPISPTGFGSRGDDLPVDAPVVPEQPFLVDRPGIGVNVDVPQDNSVFGPSVGQDVPQQGPGFNQDVPQQDSGFNQDVPQQGSGFDRNVPQQGPGFGQDTPQQDSGFGQEVSQQGPGYGPEEGPGFGQDIPQRGPGYGQEVPQQGPSFGQDVPQQGPGFRPDVPKQEPGYGPGGQDVPQEGPGFGQRGPDQGTGFEDQNRPQQGGTDIQGGQGTDYGARDDWRLDGKQNWGQDGKRNWGTQDKRGSDGNWRTPGNRVKGGWEPDNSARGRKARSWGSHHENGFNKRLGSGSEENWISLEETGTGFNTEPKTTWGNSNERMDVDYDDWDSERKNRRAKYAEEGDNVWASSQRVVDVPGLRQWRTIVEPEKLESELLEDSLEHSDIPRSWRTVERDPKDAQVKKAKLAKHGDGKEEQEGRWSDIVESADIPKLRNWRTDEQNEKEAEVKKSKIAKNWWRENLGGSGEVPDKPKARVARDTPHLFGGWRTARNSYGHVRKYRRNWNR